MYFIVIYSKSLQTPLGGSWVRFVYLFMVMFVQSVFSVHTARCMGGTGPTGKSKHVEIATDTKTVHIGTNSNFMMQLAMLCA